MKLIYTLLILSFLLLGLNCYALTYDQGGYSLSGSPEDGWRLTGTDFTYFAMWIGEDLGAIWYYAGTNLYQCIMIRNGTPYNCSLKDLSILMYNY